MAMETASANSRNRDDLPGQRVELLRQRRLFELGRLQQPGDMPNLGRHAGRGDQDLAGAARDVGVHVRHVHAVAQRRLHAC